MNTATNPFTKETNPYQYMALQRGRYGRVWAYGLDWPGLRAVPDELSGRVNVVSLSLDPPLLQQSLGLLEILESLLLDSQSLSKPETGAVRQPGGG